MPRLPLNPARAAALLGGYINPFGGFEQFMLYCSLLEEALDAVDGRVWVHSDAVVQLAAALAPALGNFLNNANLLSQPHIHAAITVRFRS